MMNRAMADAVLELREYNRYMKGIFSFVGFSTKWIPFRNTERAAGESKWSFRSLFRYALDGILSFSSAPASLSGAAGALLLIASLVTFLGFLFSGYFLPESDRNIVLLLVSLILMLHGVQMLFLAILGQYISGTTWRASTDPSILKNGEAVFKQTDIPLTLRSVPGTLHPLSGNHIWDPSSVP